MTENETLNTTLNAPRGPDPVRAIRFRWTLDRLYRHPDLIDRLRREEYELAWGALSEKRWRSTILAALEKHPEIEAELATRVKK
jgi:hypothetical protein